jgi:hypothetical protein
MGTIRLLVTAAASAALFTTITAAGAEAQAAATSSARPAAAATQTASAKPKVKKTRRVVNKHKTGTKTATRTAGREDGPVIRGRDTIALVAMLPWWRTSGAPAIEPQAARIESPVLSGADVWFGLSPGTISSDGGPIAVVTAKIARDDDLDDDTVAIADPGEVNAIDLTASDPPPTDATWMHAFLAMLGGAVAAASTARFLLV